MKPVHFLLILAVTMSTSASCAEVVPSASKGVDLGVFNVKILNVDNEDSKIFYHGQNGEKEAAGRVTSTFTIRNNGPRAAFLKGLRIEELSRTYQPFAVPGLANLSPTFEKAVVIESTKLHIDIPISYVIQPNELGQFALVFSSNVQGGNLEIWIKVTLIYDEGSEVSDILHLSLQNYGYIIIADPGNGWLITPGGGPK